MKPRKGGIWEVAIRRSFLDLNSNIVQGGQQINTTLGLNWYTHENMRLMFNYIHIDTDAAAGNDDPHILQMRLQLTF